MVVLTVENYSTPATLDPRLLRCVADRRVRTPREAARAAQLAEILATREEPEQTLSEAVMFAALNACAYRAARRGGRRPILPSERSLWAARWKIIRDFIVDQNVGLVYATLTRFHPKQADWDDFRSEALLALVRAVEGFNPWRGFRFSTYACSAIMRSLVHAAKKVSRHRLRFPMELEVEREIPETEDARTELYLDRLRQALEANLGELTERESKVLARRFPMDGELRLTLEEIGDDFGLSKERVRQIQRTALTKLRAVLEADPALQ